MDRARVLAAAPSLAVAFVAVAVAAEDKPLTLVEARERLGDKITIEMTVQTAKDRLDHRGEIYLDARAVPMTSSGIS
jgi:hypothetical protein